MPEVNLKKTIQVYSEELEKGIQEFASTLATVIVKEQALLQAKKQHQAQSKQAQKDRHEKQLNQELSTITSRIENGAHLLMQKLIEFEEIFSATVLKDLEKLIGMARIFKTKSTPFLEQVTQGKTLFEIAEITDATFEILYKAATELYSEKHFEQSADAFGFLSLINPKSYSCWLGLANSQFFLKRYEEALFAYTWCCQVNPMEPTCHIFSSRCYEEINELDNAINAIDLALFVANTHSGHSTIEAQLIKEKQRLIANQNSGSKK